MFLHPAPDKNGKPAAAEKPMLATVPSQLLRLPADERAGERETLEKKTANLHEEANGSRNKSDPSSGFRAGLKQADVVAAGQIVSDRLARKLEAQDTTAGQRYLNKRRELAELESFGR